MNSPGYGHHNPSHEHAAKPCAFVPVEHDGSLSPVTLVKGPHRWTFSCDPGDESALLSHLSELATNPDVPFDWFDAALVSHQLSRRLTRGLARGSTPGPHSRDNKKEDRGSGVVVKKDP